MPQTTNLKLPYPALTDQPNGPVQIGALAEKIDTTFAGWFSPRMKQVQRTGTGQSIPDSAGTLLVGFNSTPLVIGSSIAYTGGVFTVDFTGAVEVVVSVIWPVVSAAHRTRLRILKNGAQTLDGIDTKWYPTGTAGQTGQEVISRTAVVPGDQISQEAYQDSGGAVTIADDSAVFYIRRIG